ncbi:MAG: HAMP domain-containing histidine kinase [Defluviitaleaceae bacterium]|nr:HAMP domain-containing histidine kinase [Defluviitaleaceae bacterium]
MPVSKKEIRKFSVEIRKIIDGQEVDLRDNREGDWSALKNDVHTLASCASEQAASFKRERDALAETLADISHQIKTPLASMAVMADLLENAPQEKQAEFLANIKMGITRLDWLASALLKMAKLDAGAVTLARESMHARELIGFALDPLRILLDIKNQSAEICGDVILLCDRKWTAEALTNIIKNAAENSPEGGVIRIDCGRNPICSRVSVADCGPGIPRDKLSGLFRRFENSRGGDGHGIGLPLALAIMRGQNGDIEVESSEGTGTTFTLKFFG